MNTCVRKRSRPALVLLLAGIAAMAGCISFDSKDMQWAMGQTVGLPMATSIAVAGASHIYRENAGRWPTSLEEIRSMNCTNTDQRQEMSNFLAGVDWKAITNAVFKTTPEGKLTISLGFAPKTASTNGTSISWDGGQVTMDNIQ